MDRKLCTSCSLKSASPQWHDREKARRSKGFTDSWPLLPHASGRNFENNTHNTEGKRRILDNIWLLDISLFTTAMRLVRPAKLQELMQSEPHIPILPCGCAAAGLHNAGLPKLGHVSTLGIWEMSFFISGRRKSKMTASLFSSPPWFPKRLGEGISFELSTA